MDIRLFLPDLKGRHKGFFRTDKACSLICKKGVNSTISLICMMCSGQGYWDFFSGLKVCLLQSLTKAGMRREMLSAARIKSALKHSVVRYCDTFARAGFPVTLSEGPWIIPSSEALAKVSGMIDNEESNNIGVAPYAKHDLKMWPEEYMIKLLWLIAEKHEGKFLVVWRE